MDAGLQIQLASINRKLDLLLVSMADFEPRANVVDLPRVGKLDIGLRLPVLAKVISDGGHTMISLAKAFECNPKTIGRDIKRLRTIYKAKVDWCFTTRSYILTDWGSIPQPRKDGAK